jgi:hypothetical protein
MPKDEWECEFCGEVFNSRAARLYHRRNVCTKDPRSKAHPDNLEKPGETAAKAPAIETRELNVETAETEQNPPPKPPAPAETIAKATPKPRGPPRPPSPGPAPEPVTDEITGEEIEETPWILVVLLILVCAFVAGALIFRHKLIAFYRARFGDGNTAVQEPTT